MRTIENNFGLETAVMENNAEAVKRAIENGAEVNITESKEHGYYHVLCSVRSVSVAKLLIEAGSNVNDRTSYCNQTPLHCIVFRGHKNLVKYFLKIGANVNAVDGIGQTPIMLSSNHNLAYFVRLFKPYGVNLDAQRRDGSSLIKRVVMNGDLNTLKCLAEYGANLNIQDLLGYQTPLMYAVAFEQPDIVEYLLEKNVDLSLRDYNGKTALDYGSECDNDHIRFLVYKYSHKERCETVMDLNI